VVGRYGKGKCSEKPDVIITVDDEDWIRLMTGWLHACGCPVVDGSVQSIIEMNES
jgi:hypothetical protein